MAGRARRTSRAPLSDAYARLGSELRRVRELAGKTTYEVPKNDGAYYKSGHVSNVEGGFTAPSDEFIKAYVGFGGRYDDLMTLLDRAKRPSAAASEHEDVIEQQLLDPRTDPYTLRRGYTVDLQEDIVHLDDRGIPVRNIYTATVRPQSPNARYFLFRYGREEDQRRGVATVQAGPGCSIALLDEDDNGTVYTVLEFDQAKIDELGRCRLSWSIEINSSVPTQPFDAIHTRSRMAHIAKRVQFESPAIPTVIWWFRGADPFANRLEPSSEQILEPSPVHFYAHDFYDIENEACGLAWQWDIS